MAELIIVQIEPTRASGCPDAVGPPGGRIVVIVPESGIPVTPGDNRTEQPMVTGGPGIS